MDKTKDKKKVTSVILIAIVIMIVLWLSSYFVISFFFTKESAKGTFGDSFGAVNALFSGIALAGVIYTIFLQRIELSYQREELRETRKEFQIQNQTLKRQRFENTFFHMLSLHNEIVNKLSFEGEHQNYAEREYFEYIFYELALLKSPDITVEYETDKDTWSAIQDCYNTMFIENHGNLGHYFRNLYHIFKYIHLSKLIEKDEKQFYASIVRAQLSTFELAIMFYNSLVKDLGYPKFKYLIEKYDLIQNINEMNLLNNEHLSFYYRIKTDNPFPQVKE